MRLLFTTLAITVLLPGVLAQTTPNAGSTPSYTAGTSSNSFATPLPIAQTPTSTSTSTTVPPHLVTSSVTSVTAGETSALAAKDKRKYKMKKPKTSSTSCVTTSGSMTISTMCPTSSSAARRVAIPLGGARARLGLGSSQDPGFFELGRARMIFGSGGAAVVVGVALRFGLGLGWLED